MKKRRYFNSPAISQREEITSASHPWASSAAGVQSHTQVCSFQPATKYASRLRPLRYRNFKERALNVNLNYMCVYKPDMTALLVFSLLTCSAAVSFPAMADEVDTGVATVNFVVNESLDGKNLRNIVSSSGPGEEGIVAQESMVWLSAFNYLQSSGTTWPKYRVDSEGPHDVCGSLYFGDFAASSGQNVNAVSMDMKRWLGDVAVDYVYVEARALSPDAVMKIYPDGKLANYTECRLEPCENGYQWYRAPIGNKGYSIGIGGDRRLADGSDNRFLVRAVKVVLEGSEWHPVAEVPPLVPAPWPLPDDGRERVTVYFENASHWGSSGKRADCPDGILKGVDEGEYVFVMLGAGDEKACAAPGIKVCYDDFFNEEGYYTGPRRWGDVVFSLTDAVCPGDNSGGIPVALLAVSFPAGDWDSISFSSLSGDVGGTCADEYGNALSPVLSGAATALMPVARDAVYSNIYGSDAVAYSNCDHNALEPAGYMKHTVCYRTRPAAHTVPFVCFYESDADKGYCFVTVDGELVKVVELTRCVTAYGDEVLGFPRDASGVYESVELNVALKDVALCFADTPDYKTACGNGRIWRAGDDGIGAVHCRVFAPCESGALPGQALMVKGNVRVNGENAAAGKELAVDASTGLMYAALEPDGNGEFVLYRKEDVEMGTAGPSVASLVCGDRTPCTMKAGGHSFRIEEPGTLVVDAAKATLRLTDRACRLDVTAPSETERVTGCGAFGGLRLHVEIDAADRSELKVGVKPSESSVGGDTAAEVPFSLVAASDREDGENDYRLFIDTPGVYDICLSTVESALCAAAGSVMVSGVTVTPTPVSTGMMVNNSPVGYSSDGKGSVDFTGLSDNALFCCEVSGRRIWHYWSPERDEALMDPDKEGSMAYEAGAPENGGKTWAVAADGGHWLALGPENARIAFDHNVLADPDAVQVWYRIEGAATLTACRRGAPGVDDGTVPDGFMKYNPRTGIDLTEAMDMAHSMQVVLAQNGIRSDEYTVSLPYTTGDIVTNVDDTECDRADDTPVYYTQTGLRVDAARLERGIYLECVGTGCRKVVVK